MERHGRKEDKTPQAQDTQGKDTGEGTKKERIIVIDTETTGVEPQDRVIETCAVKWT